MRRFVSLVSLALMVSCGGQRDQAVQQEGAMPPAISLADVAGTWTMHTMNAAGDSTLATGSMTMTGTREGWTMSLPNRDPIPVRVIVVDGDSIVTEAGPFQSVLRQGVMVSTRTVLRFDGDALAGPLRASYQTAGADSVLNARMHMVRAP